MGLSFDCIDGCALKEDQNPSVAKLVVLDNIAR